MTDELPETAPQTPHSRLGGLTSKLPEISGRTKAIIGVSIVVLLVVGYLILQRFLPQWWGREIAADVGGSFTRGSLYGLGYGLLGSAVTLILLYFAYVTIGRYRNIVSWTLLVLALASTVPNLLTLSVVIGNGSGAESGRLALDYDGMGFRGATLIGLIIGIVIGLAVDFYLLGKRRAKAKAEVAA
ncbi:permease [Gordonia sp. PDNC005]|uniref:permease n=1 Tax=unclassified Gordonia (in: high G+C Gram-positive bacteria) TaxID=2657482 RepID=UPI001965D9BE|nr:permease [Gordonia sp. PDNC005]QRY62257.1 permease [Gordonia sp. PDNC005]